MNVAAMIMGVKRFRLIFVLLWLGCLSVETRLSADDFPPVYDSPNEKNQTPMAAEEAASTMQLPDGFRATVFASEPDVQNPIAMAWDDRGRMWVAENYTYAERAQRFDLSLRDRVIILEDADQDGRAERRSVFTDQVQMLTSVEVGRGGVWLMCPPQLLFIPDHDGDDVPDAAPEVVLDGFTVAQDNYHNFANGLRWGPDGWLYGRCGHSCPGRIGTPGTPDEQRVPIDGGVWRYHPERKVTEVLCHGTTNPWGHDWDSNGELFFINTVIGHLWHVMPGAHFKESFGESMNPAVYSRIDMIADHYHFDTNGKWTDSRDGKANDLGGGHAHIGMMIYQGDAWPQAYHNRLFTLNMHGKRANVERLERQGAGYVGKHEPDFFISQDPFFRGLEISTGPDGQVYVADWSDTGECHEHTGVHRTSGRIFKITYDQSTTPRELTKPACLAGPGPLPALWRDYQAGRTTPSQLRELLEHPNEHQRVWAIRLLSDFWPLDTVVGPLAGSVYPDDRETFAKLLQLSRDDRSGLVLSTLASTLQRLPVEKRSELAAGLVGRREFAQDRDLPLMVWFGLIPVAETYPEQIVELARDCELLATTHSMARFIASRIEEKPELLDELLTATVDRDIATQQMVLDGVVEAFRGWRRAPRPQRWDAFCKSAVAQSHPDVIRELQLLFGDGRAMEEIRGIVLNGQAEMKARVSALQTLIDARSEDLSKICEQVLSERTLNAVAARGLAIENDPRVAKLLINQYRRFHPDDRSSVMELLVSRRGFAKELLDHVEKGQGRVSASDIKPFHARQILNLGDKTLEDQLSSVWGELRDSPVERREKIERYKAELTSDVLRLADLSRGRLLFSKSCAQCHMLFGAGEKIGPDLTGAQRSSLEYLLENILDPSAVVGKDYRMTVVLTADGRVLSGLLVSQNDKTLVLQTQTTRETIPMSEVEMVEQKPLSPMPDGMLDHLAAEEVRDLIGYLMSPTQVSLPAN